MRVLIVYVLRLLGLVDSLIVLLFIRFAACYWVVCLCVSGFGLVWYLLLSLFMA